MVNPHTLRFGLVGSKACHVLLTPQEYAITFEEILKEERKGKNSDIKAFDSGFKLLMLTCTLSTMSGSFQCDCTSGS